VFPALSNLWYATMGRFCASKPTLVLLLIVPPFCGTGSTMSPPGPGAG